jgi:DNA-directed RNA polymerase subunit beta'
MQHIATLLAIPPKKLRRLADCVAFMVVNVGKSKWKPLQLISLAEYETYAQDNPWDKRFQALTGGKLLIELLEKTDLEELIKELRAREPSRRVNRRLMLARDMHRAEIRPRWMLVEHLLVLPPDLRPVLALDDGTSASSDLNELYARVIHRNNRLREFYAAGAIEKVLGSERRLLQAAVDALLYNEKRGNVKNRSGKKVLKSLSAMIEGKRGRIRRNLLGKRVDYSARSVIAVGPDLKLNQCGLPLDLAMDMCRPLVYGRLRRIGHAASLKHARKMVEDRHPSAVDALEYELRERTVLLNRAPSLHRMSIQAFNPVIVAGRAIRLHPLVCSAFNADFDGDQMGVHLPLSIEAQIEANVLMLSVNNLLSPASGKVSVAPSQDIVLGVYYLTKASAKGTGTGKVFADKDDLSMAYDMEVVDLHAKVKVRIDGALIETTAGRVFFSGIFGDLLPFSMLNKTIKKKDLGKLVEEVYGKAGAAETVSLLDRIKEIGFKYATQSGVSLCMDDITIPKEKYELIEMADEAVREINQECAVGLWSEVERYNKVVNTWRKTSDDIAEVTMDRLGIPEGGELSDEQKIEAREFNSMFMMADSGARGSKEQIRQVAGMRGLMSKPTGEIVETPIKSNFKEGLSCFEFLLSCHGARKGRADGALKTANAGYFTRRLVDVAHDIIIEEMDCQTIRGIEVSALYDGQEVVIPLAERITGRIATRSVMEPGTGLILVERGAMITKEAAGKVSEAGVTSVSVRSPLVCASKKGICAMCYGYDLSQKALPKIGDAVGIIAAQSIGEPGTQLTLRTFHSGGAASGSGEISVLEARTDGKLRLLDVGTVRNDSKETVISKTARVAIESNGIERENGVLPYGAILLVGNGSEVKKGDKIAEWDPVQRPIICTSQGPVEFDCIIENVTMRSEVDENKGTVQRFIVSVSKDFVPKIIVGDKEYVLPLGTYLAVDESATARPGDVLARIPKQAARSADITGGLGRVLQILEVKKLHDPAILSEITGEVKVHLPKKAVLPVEVTNEYGHARTYYVPIEKHLNFFTGDMVSAGDMLADGIINPKDLLRVLGPERAAAHVIGEVQKVYRSQAVEMNDKHLEIVIRKMLSKVQITDSGDTDFVAEEIVSRDVFMEVNDKTTGRKATAKPLLLSITNTALLSDSWLSAASFQNTTSVLANAALKRREDPLHGTKENIIVGNMVPVGTGHQEYRNTFLIPESLTERETRKELEIKKAYEKFNSIFRE